MDHQQPVIALLARNLPLGITISGTSIWRKNSAASRQPFWPKSVTHVTGTLSFLCVRSGPRVYMERAMGIEIIATWFFKDLRSRARTDLEGLGTLRNPYCRLDAALLP
jgi:hypothetical protein